MKQEQTTKKLKLLLMALILILVCAISFFGIRVKELNTWKNLIPEFEFEKELTSMRILTFRLDDSTKEVENKDNADDSTTVDVDKTASKDSDVSVDGKDKKEDSKDEKKEVPVNPTEILTKENYDKVKEIVEARLARGDISDSEVTLDYDSGELSVYVPFNDADHIADYVVQQGILEIKDSTTEETLISKDEIASVKTFGRQNPGEEGRKYEYGLTIKLTKSGLEKLSNITKTYIDVIGTDGKSEPKTVDVMLDGEKVYTTYFDPSGTYDELNIPIYATDDEEQAELRYEATKIAEITINSGYLPIIYKAGDSTYLGRESNMRIVTIIAIAFGIAAAAISVLLILKKKQKGLIATICGVSYIAAYLLLVRYAKEPLTLFSMFSIAALSFINYMLTIKLMNRNPKHQTVGSIIGDLIAKIIPLIIIAVVFVFATNIELKSVGTVLFWGLLVILPFNLIFTNPMFEDYNELQKIGGKN